MTNINEHDRERFRASLRRLSMRQGHVERALRVAIRACCWVFDWSIEVNYASEIPNGLDRGRRAGTARGAGCLIAAAPHRAWLEPFLLIAAWPPDAARLVWIGDGPTMTSSRWRRLLLPRLGAIPISGDVGGPRAYAELAAEVLDAGAAVAIFPEKGPPSAPDSTRTISPGFAYIARRAGAPIVPVVMGGTHRIVRGSSFTVDVLEAIDVGSSDPDPFRPEGRAAAHELGIRYDRVVNELLPERTALADVRRPTPERWRWLGTLFH